MAQEQKIRLDGFSAAVDQRSTNQANFSATLDLIFQDLFTENNTLPGTLPYHHMSVWEDSLTQFTTQDHFAGLADQRIAGVVVREAEDKPAGLDLVHDVQRLSQAGYLGLGCVGAVALPLIRPPAIAPPAMPRAPRRTGSWWQLVEENRVAAIRATRRMMVKRRKRGIRDGARW